MLTFGGVEPSPIVQIPASEAAFINVVMSCWNSNAEQTYNAGKLIVLRVLSAILLLQRQISM